MPRLLWAICLVSSLALLTSTPATAQDKSKNNKGPKLTEYVSGTGETDHIDFENSKIKLKIKDVKMEEYWVPTQGGNGKLQGMINNAGGLKDYRLKEEIVYKEYSISPNVEVYIWGAPEAKAPPAKSDNKGEDKAKDKEKDKEGDDAKKTDDAKGKDEKMKDEGSKDGTKPPAKSPSKTGSGSSKKPAQPKMSWIKAKTDQVVKGQNVFVYVAKSSDRNDPANYVTRIYVIPNNK